MVSIQDADDYRTNTLTAQKPMPNTNINDVNGRAARWSGAIFGLAYPTVATLVYFVWAERFSAGVQQATYAAVKSLQFVVPAVWMWAVLHEPIRLQRPRRGGVGLGLAFGLATLVAAWLLYHQWLSGTPTFSSAAEQIRDKILSFGLDSAWKYAALGLFYSLLHSLLEEYYWRWFVFGQLRSLTSAWPAILVSAAGFTAHHVVILATFFGLASPAVPLLSLAVAVGGIFWAWLYERSGSLYGPWLSHLLVDAAIFVIGYDLLRDQLPIVGA
jgi:membrane protease YdiL (CAAX protease family)